ncbi:fatty acyl-CoA reductase, putative [Phytophthora infestans T30-4]|uniref:Fatty acyl-CoA reductase, putative n=1 Tax=Phytophthora infestans (strain T30-4) TaxID=403677 RepID=D0NE51_PHYIT|nr:fatty acyl-CoA reductase, putative [Phytophthora infestans T30-4]EEY56496.1 fatty acyl-CoA reductase, putative [Phytophthora infestans T30-4]|eukprot:XP_002902570.1 fatty acyl-CoA reductase, putative [Phytophthora infestans T30-4]
MEQIYAGQSLFITGGTGFLAKTVIEKLLRCTPNIAKIFVLIRPRKGVASAERLQKEIIDSRVFDRLRAERPNDFEAFAREKLHAIAGDITTPDLGLSAEDARLLRACVQISIHSAATVQFDEPLEVAVEMNCVGSLNIAKFVQSCPGIRCHLHVSTAYVNSNRRDTRISEELYPLDFDAHDALRAVTTASPSELERLRVNLMGTYPNTYTLTKSMTEHLLVREIAPNFPLIIYRPTIIGASWKEPMPGWIDQIAAAGAIFLAAGMGVLTMLPGDPRNVADIVPVDLAVNSILLSICAKIQEHESSRVSSEPSCPLVKDVAVNKPMVVHCGTSDPRQNPLRWRIPCVLVPEYFRKNPPARGLFPAKFSMIPTHQSFQIQWFLTYALPSSVYSTVANKSGHPGHIKNAAKLWQLTWRARNLVELFKPFTENQWIFVADAAEKTLRPYATKDFWIDSHEIAWERYVLNYCVGLKKYMLHEDVIDVDIEGVNQTQLALSTGRILDWDPDHHAISFPGLLSDVAWAYTSSRKPGYTKSGLLGRVMGITGWKEGMNHEASHVPRPHVESVGGLRNSVLESDVVRAAIKERAVAYGMDIDDVERQAASILSTMAAQLDYKAVRKLGWLLRKVCRNMYDQIHVDETGLTRIRELLAERRGSVVLVPTHRSYVDFLLMSYVFFAYNIPVPYVAAGEDFLHMGSLSKLLRESGAYFIRRSFSDDPLYSAVFRAYTQYLVSRGHTIEFFIEGSRSRSGKQLHPKFGILNTVVDCYLSEKVKNLYIVPVTIDYEKPLEVLLHQNELLGEGKIRESISALFKAMPIVRKKFGSISVKFGVPLDVKQHVDAALTRAEEQEMFVPTSAIVEDLGYAITDALIDNATCAMSHVVAAILLVYRQGISKQELVRQADWLRLEILRRGGRVVGTQGRSPTVVVDRALELLHELVTMRRKDLVEPAITSREQYPNMIGLGYYRNKILHWFNREGVVACAYQALDAFNLPFGGSSSQSVSSNSESGVDRQELLDGALFLYEMLTMEFVRKDDPEADRAHLVEALAQLETRNVLVPVATSSSRLEAADGAMLSLLSTLMWPFIDSYWVAVTSLFALRPHGEVSTEDLLKRLQWLAETMYHEKLISFYESCSRETLQNALALLERWGVLSSRRLPSKEKSKPNANKPAVQLLSLSSQYVKDGELEQLALRVSKFRKLPPGVQPATTSETEVLARLPALSRM